ncbi:MAG: hypothetical protein AAGK25_09500 [Pseudomonadota bacterium]
MAADSNTDSDLKISIEDPLNKEHATAFSECPHFDEICVRDQDLITVNIAQAFIPIRSVYKMTVWCSITRAAMRYVISRPNLKELVVFELKPPGYLTGFEDAHDLTYFSCPFGLNVTDLLELAECTSLEKLGAQQAKITEKALASLLELPLLTEIDFECSNFNDGLADIVSQSKTVTRFEIGATRITRDGLEKICSMKQLRGLDVWANDISETDLDLLVALPNLEYLSIGGHDEQTTFTLKGTLPILQQIPSLTHLWLDGFRVTKDEWAYLNDRYDKVHVTAVID